MEMNPEKAEKEFTAVYTQICDSLALQGKTPGDDAGIVTAIVYLGAKINELTETIREMKQ